MLTRRAAALVVGALSACAVLAGGGVLLQAQVLRFGARTPSETLLDVPAIAVPRTAALWPAPGVATSRPHGQRRSGPRGLVSVAVLRTRVAGAPAAGLIERRAVVPARSVATVESPGGASVAVESPEPIVERHPIPAPQPPNVAPRLPGVDATGAPASAAPESPTVTHGTPDHVGVAGPRLVSTPAELAPPADPAPVVSRADNAPPTAEATPPSTPAPATAPDPEPVAAEPTPAEPAPPPAEPGAPAEPTGSEEPVPAVPPTAAESTPPADEAVTDAVVSPGTSSAPQPDATAEGPVPGGADATSADAPAPADVSAATG